MKFNQYVLTLSPVIAAMTLGLCACGSFNEYDYDHAKLYSAGNGNIASVSRLDVDWIGGAVEIKISETATEITFSEETEETEEKYLMHWRTDGDTLRIKYLKSGTTPKNNMKKKLAIQIPASSALAELKVEAVSGDIMLNGVNAAECNLETVSGNVSLTEITASTLTAESVSGDLNMGNGTYGSVDAETVSGKITLENAENPLHSFKAETVSGNVRLWTRRCPPLAEIETTSGDAEIIFSEGAGFTLTFRTSSGIFDSQFETTKNGKTYTAAGEGNGSVLVNTTSGNVTVRKILNG